MSDTVEVIILAKDEASRTIGGVRSALGGLGGAMATAGTAIIGKAMAAGDAMVEFVASSVGVARDFESAMAVMSTAVDPAQLGVSSAAEAMAIMGNAALTVGADTALVGVSASSAADSITGLYKAGLSTGEIFGDLQGYLAGTTELGGALRASVDLAAASELDMVAASELAAITLATFGGELTTTEERAAFVESAMNNFVQTADGSVASVGDLAAAMTNVGSTMASFGIPLEDVNTALGILSTRGIIGAEAGTALKSMFLNMMTAPGAQKALAGLNIELYDMEGNMKPLPSIIGDIEKSMAGMTQEQRDQLGITLAGSYGIKAFSALLGEGTDGWNDMTTAIGNASTMQETAAARTNTFEGAMEGLSGVMESLKISVGLPLIQQVLTPMARLFAELATKHGPALTAFFTAVGAGIGRLIEIVGGGQLGELFTVWEDGSSVLDSLLQSFGMTESAARSLSLTIINFVNGLKTFTAPIAAFITEFVTMKDVLIAAGVAVAAVLIPIIASIISAIAPVILIFAGVALAAALLRTAWEENWGGIQEKTAVVVEYIKGIIQGGLEFIQNLWAVHGGTITGIVQTVMSTIQAVIGAALAGIQSFWDQHGAAIMAVVSAAWGFIQTFIQVAVALIVGTAQAGLETVRAFWESHGAAIMKAAQVAWEFISRIIEGVLEHVKLVFDAWRALLQGDFETFKAKMVEIWQNLWDTVVDVLRGLWERFSPLFQELWSRISGWFSSMDWASLGRSVIMGIVNGLRNAAGALWSAIQDIIQQARSAAGAAAGEGSPARLFIPLGEAIGQGIIVGIQNTAGDMMTTLEGLMKNISSVAGLGGAFANLFEARNITPVEARLKSLSDELAGFMPDLEGELASMGKLWNDPGLREFLQGKIASSAFGSDEWASATRALAMYDRRLELMRQQAALQGQLEAGQNRLLLLETQRQQIGFLQQQFELLKLIRENGLGADILEGLTLGLEADPGALMNAMIAALQQMIAAAENELGIASPSKWAQRTMQNVIGSMADTLNRGSTLVRDGLSLTPARIAAVDGGRAGGGSAGMVVNIDARRAERGVDRDLKAMVEEVMRTYGTRADIRMRTS